MKVNLETVQEEREKKNPRSLYELKIRSDNGSAYVRAEKNDLRKLRLIWQFRRKFWQVHNSLGVHTAHLPKWIKKMIPCQLCRSRQAIHILREPCRQD